MKKRIYFILFLFYFVVLGFILHLNGVFTGEVSSYENLLINVGFLLLIGVLFLISAFSFARLNRCTDVLAEVTDAIYEKYQENGENLWLELKKKEEFFGHPVLDEAFDRYRLRLKNYSTKKGLRQTCDLEEYINEDLLDQIGASHYNANLSGTMTGLGILGTFLGLSLGLGAFSGDDIFTIADNVGPLLSGMKVAFHTSIYGILFSLVFTFIYRSIMAYSYEILSDFLLCFRECVMPPVSNANDTADAMLIYQANMANSMQEIQKLLKGNALEQTQGVEKIVQAFTSQLSEHMGTDFEKMGQALHTACEAQALYSRNYQSLEATTRELLESNRILMQTLEHTMQRQEIFAHELQNQQQQLSQACETLNEDISNQLYTFNQMRNLYEK
ncbi:MAG: MotA/TolQ/ExbB proton channel family protein [Lachnospiraceae bacterium]|nr:MotA/TolQ/ExbB proton channel family protein [Lachnospiraceae bacterium]